MKKLTFILISIFSMTTLAACSVSRANVPTVAAVQAKATAVPATATTSSTMAVTAAAPKAAAPTAVSTKTGPTPEVVAQREKIHEQAEDYQWDAASVVSIKLNGNSIASQGSGVTIEGSKATITAAGTYSLSGTINDGQIIVNAGDKDIVRLIFNGVDLRYSAGAPVNIIQAKKVIIVLADNTKNTVTDAKDYVFETEGVDEPNAAVFSKVDLTIYGNGSLAVNGNFNDGIASKDGLLIKSGNLTVNAVDDGIRGKDYLVVIGGTLTVNARGDGLKADNEEDATRGYIAIESGTFHITAAKDAITARTEINITDGKFTVTSGGGSGARADAVTSTKGMKAGVKIRIDGGAFNINASDDAVNTNGDMLINGGTFAITTGDDGMHADATLTINGGDIRITKSYEGIESAVITINDGNIAIVSSDDGLNVAGGRDGSGAAPPGRGMQGRGQDAFTYSGKYFLYINGGYIVIESVGDGIDVNGAVEMTNGVAIVNGPTVRMNSAIDYDAYFNIKGGVIVGAGSSGMAQAPGEGSSQPALLLNFSSTQRAGTVFHIQDSQGKNILTFTPTKDYQSIAFSSPELIKGATYEVYLGGKSTGTVQNGLYQGGVYSSGTKYTTFTISTNLTRIGAGIR